MKSFRNMQLVFLLSCLWFTPLVSSVQAQDSAPPIPPILQEAYEDLVALLRKDCETCDVEISGNILMYNQKSYDLSSFDEAKLNYTDILLLKRNINAIQRPDKQWVRLYDQDSFMTNVGSTEWRGKINPRYVFMGPIVKGIFSPIGRTAYQIAKILCAFKFIAEQHALFNPSLYENPVLLKETLQQ